MKAEDVPTCSCGSKAFGLVFISAEQRYQCGECIIKVYDALASVDKVAIAKTVRDAYLEKLDDTIEHVKMDADTKRGMQFARNLINNTDPVKLLGETP